MAAHESLAPRQFHGTNANLQPGDTILPGNEIKGMNSPHSSLVWSTSDPEWAGAHGGTVYEIEHQGMSNEKPSVHGIQVSLGAKVVRKHQTSVGYARGKVR